MQRQADASLGRSDGIPAPVGAEQVNHYLPPNRLNRVDIPARPPLSTPLPATAVTEPRVSVVVPMRNEESGIIECLESILANQVEGDLEVLVLNGDSDDRSPALVEELSHRDPRVKLVPNPARLQADAFNIGLELARGEFLVRMDAHTLYEPDYISECVRLLEETGAENVGGVQSAVGSSVVSCAIAAAVASRFAAGDAKYRNSTEPAWVDTVYLGAWRTETVRELGGMIPGYAVNEDYEMNIRLRRAGGRIYLSPTIRSSYSVRGSLPKLTRQYFRYGLWKVRTLMLHPGSLRWRQMVAPLFVLSLLAAPVLYALVGMIGLSHIFLYLTANLLASIRTASNTSWSNLPLLPVVFALIHLSWGSGFLTGMARWPLSRTDANQ